MKRLFYLTSCFTLSVFACYSQVWERIQVLPALPNHTPNLIAGTSFSDTIIIAEDKGIFIRSNDFLQSIFIDSTHSGKLIHSMSFANRKVGYVTSSYATGGMIKTVDGGLTWHDLSFSNSINSPGNILCFTNPDTGYVAYSSLAGGFRYTKNGGQYWSNPPILNFECPRIFRIQFINDSTGYILSNDDPNDNSYHGDLHLFKTTDYGHSWVDINHLQFFKYPTGMADILFTDDTTAIISTDQVILRSTDAGLSFDTAMVSNNLTDVFNTAIQAISFANRDTGYIAYWNSIYRTFDAGTTWSKTAFAFSQDEWYNSILFIRAVSPTKVMVGCGDGVVYKTETGGGVWSGIEEEKEDNNISVYPNPAINRLLITSQEEKISDSQFKVVNLLGQVANEGTVLNNSIDISTLPSGVYVLMLNIRHKQVHTKFIKQ